jgi:hypothetical protein
MLNAQRRYAAATVMDGSALTAIDALPHSRRYQQGTPAQRAIAIAISSFGTSRRVLLWPRPLCFHSGLRHFDAIDPEETKPQAPPRCVFQVLPQWRRGLKSAFNEELGQWTQSSILQGDNTR